ncbi:hypothetical protein TorRG33x02_141700 [Trema orientale]|uniref:Uncharacterized protein n=1 Tax=Trema orientale TaxID=63057 RepID=A0A2P5EX70_TREOI|nr:hypothetical protein TorRG33x02_141700 [Trema orientale]
MKDHDHNLAHDDQFSQLSSSLIVPNSDQVVLDEDFIKFANPKERMKKFVVDKVLKYLKVPEPIKTMACRSGAFVDCVLSKFWGCSFVDNEKFTQACYGGVGAICLKQFKGGNNLPTTPGMMGPFS